LDNTVVFIFFQNFSSTMWFWGIQNTVFFSLATDGVGRGYGRRGRSLSISKYNGGWTLKSIG